MNSDATIEYAVRVKLPSLSEYEALPDGDVRYNDDTIAIILKNKPKGFEVSWSSRNSWPKDSDGMTWVKLYCPDKTIALEHCIDKIADLKRNHLRAIHIIKEGLSCLDSGI